MSFETATAEPTELVPTEATPDTTPVVANEEAASIADHAASFSPAARAEDAQASADAEVAARARDEQGRFAKAHAAPESRERHRATSQRATANDVPEINALTKELREKERQLAALKPDALSASPRITALRRQIRAIEADLKDLSTPSAAPSVAEPAPPATQPAPADRPRETPSARPQPSGQPAHFSEPEPTFEDFAGESDQYTAYLRAVARWEMRKDNFEAAQTYMHQAAQQQAAAAFNAKINAFAQTVPDFQAKVTPFLDEQLPSLLVEAIARDDNAGQLVYYLATHPAAASEFVLRTDGRQVSDVTVAAVQRLLRQHAQAATTGSATVPARTVTPPRPPNPVRTGPVRTADEPPPDGASIAEHARYYSPKRR